MLNSKWGYLLPIINSKKSYQHYEPNLIVIIFCSQKHTKWYICVLGSDKPVPQVGRQINIPTRFFLVAEQLYKHPCVFVCVSHFSYDVIGRGNDHCLNDQAHNCLIHLRDNCTVTDSVTYMCTHNINSEHN